MTEDRHFKWSSEPLHDLNEPQGHCYMTILGSVSGMLVTREFGLIYAVGLGINIKYKRKKYKLLKISDM